MKLRDVSDWVWPTLAPHASDYATKQEHRLEAEVASVRVSCAGNDERQREFLEGVRKEFEDNQTRSDACVASLQALLTLLGAVVAVTGGVSVWLAQSHTLRATVGTVFVVAALVLYQAMQLIGAFLAVIAGLRVRPHQSLPHTAAVLGDPMDAAEEIRRANLYNTHQIDDRVSYKKLAHRFLRNSCVGFVPLVLVMVALTARNLVQ